VAVGSQSTAFNKFNKGLTMLKKRFVHLLCLAMLVAFMGSSASLRVEAQAAKTLLLPNPIGAGDVTTIDPALVTDFMSAQITSETFYTLVRGKEDDLNKIQPGMAEKWTLSPDGLTYTFTIRKGIPWVTWDGKQVAQVKGTDGQPLYVTAHDFEYGIKRVLDPVTASGYAYTFTSLIKGAADFNGSKATGAALSTLRDAVGVKASDDTTLVITLAQPAGYALNILSITNAGAQPQAVIEKNGAKWTDPGTAISYGPFVVSEWKHDASITLTKNPFWPGFDASPQPKLDRVTFLLIDQTTAFNNYQAGTIDVASAPVTDLDRVKADPVLSKELNVSAVLNSAYYGFTVTKAPFDDVRMRLAFSYAIDRQAIIDNVTKGGIAARWFSRPGIAAAPSLENSPDLGISYDPTKAKAMLKSYLDEKKLMVDQLPPITLLLYKNDTVSKVAEAIQQMWQETLGVNVQITTQDFSVFIKTVQNDPPQVYALGWSADYADANNFVREVFRSDSGNNFTHWKNATFDKLVDDAARETDVDKRTELYRQAEDILVLKDAVIAPLYWGTRFILTKPYVQRTFSQTNGDERLEKWDVTAH